MLKQSTYHIKVLFDTGGGWWVSEQTAFENLLTTAIGLTVQLVFALTEYFLTLVYMSARTAQMCLHLFIYLFITSDSIYFFDSASGLPCRCSCEHKHSS